MTDFLQQLIIGLRLGSVYALVALGYTMVYGIIRLINFAHGDFIMVGGYTLYFTVPILLSLKSVTSPFLAFVLITLALAIVSFYTSISGLVKAEMFPPQVRALGVGLAYAVANAIFGGSAEFVALSLKSVGMENSFYWYVTVMMAVAFLFSLRLPKQAAYLHHDL